MFTDSHSLSIEASKATGKSKDVMVSITFCFDGIFQIRKHFLYHLRSRGPSIAPIPAHSATIIPYQRATNGR